MYGTILCFDERTEKQIDWIWSQLAEANISFYHTDRRYKSSVITGTRNSVPVLGKEPSVEESSDRFLKNT